MATLPIPLLREVSNFEALGLPIAERAVGDRSRLTAPVPERSVRRGATLTASSRDNLPGDKYAIGAQIGFGGMGVVYEGVHRLTNRPVALKTLRPEYYHSQHAVERFVQEARVLAQVSGPGVVQMFDCEIGNLGLPYLVMERLEGEDLREWLDKRSRKALSEGSALRVMIEIARMLVSVHRQDVVHRDIKPENIFLSQDVAGRVQVRLIDFGVARAPASGTRLTLVEHAVGSLLYISPEQLRDSRDVSPASDIWSLGMLMMELLVGAHPYPADMPDTQLICRILSEEPPRIRDFAPVSEEVCRIVDRCLTVNPTERYPSAQVLLEELVSCAQRMNLAADVGEVYP
jgi:serine/threonine protein kinase